MRRDGRHDSHDDPRIETPSRRGRGRSTGDPQGDPPDAASTEGLPDAISALLPALEAFNRFDGPDPAASRSAWLPLIDEPLPEVGVGPEAVLELLRDVVIRHGLRTGNPGFSCWVTMAPTTLATAAHLAQAVASPQRWWAQAGNHVDFMAARWLVELFGFPDTYAAAFTSGGSTANLVGIGCARQHAGERLGIDTAADGFSGMPGPRVYASTEVHHVVTRAMGVLGLGRRNLRELPLDRSRRADVGHLRRLVDEDIAAGRTPIAIVGNAGDVNTGIVDDLPAMAEVAAEHDIWFHVDGAYGGWGMLDERVADRFGDVATYDSFAVDPHKWLAAPVGTGLAVCRDGDPWKRAFEVEPGADDRSRWSDKLYDLDDVDSAWSASGSGTPSWGGRFLGAGAGHRRVGGAQGDGAEGMRSRVRRHNDFARHVAERVRATEELELMAEPELSIVCFRYRPDGWQDAARIDALNEALLAELRRRGTSVPSSTVVDGAFALRACYINPRTRLSDVDRLVDEVLEIGRTLATA